MKAKNLNLQPGALLAELVGTFVLTTVAVTVANPIIVGFTLVALVFAIGRISGAHVNPAISFGLWTIRKLEGSKLPFYFAMQFAGALLALLVAQLYQDGGYGISFASFGNLDGKLFLAELLGTAVFTYLVAAVVWQRDETDTAKALCVGLALLTGLAVGGGLIGQSLQSSSAQNATEASRLSKVDGVVINPAIALAATEKSEQQDSLQSLTSETNAGDKNKRAPSRLSWETILGPLAGGAIGMNLLLLTAGGSSNLKKSDTVTTKVTAVFKKGQMVKKTVKKTKK